MDHSLWIGVVDIKIHQSSVSQCDQMAKIEVTISIVRVLFMNNDFSKSLPPPYFVFGRFSLLPKPFLSPQNRSPNQYLKPLAARVFPNGSHLFFSGIDLMRSLFISRTLTPHKPKHVYVQVTSVSELSRGYT